MILADTSVWVNHFRHGSMQLERLLDSQQVLMHAHVLGELACGNLPDRRSTLRFLHRLPAAAVATHAEALGLIEIHGLAGRGVGYGDVHILASALLTPEAWLWTVDGRFRDAAQDFGVAWNEGS